MTQSRRTGKRAQTPDPSGIPPLKTTQSLGKWIDNLLGDKKARERAAAKAAARRKYFRQVP